MPLVIEPPPEAAERVVDATMDEFLTHGGVTLARSVTPSASTPLPLYHIGADALAQSRGLSAATHVGWITTVRNGSEVVGSVELAPNPPSEEDPMPVRFARFTQGPMHADIALAVEAADKQTRRRNVRARLLRAPAVYLLALWLTDGDTDMLVPIGRAPAPLKSGEAMPAAEALAALAESAKRSLTGDDGRS